MNIHIKYDIKFIMKNNMKFHSLEIRKFLRKNKVVTSSLIPSVERNEVGLYAGDSET